MKKLFENIRLRFWARKYRRAQIVVDTSALFSGEERDRLMYLRLVVPYGVWQQVRRMAGVYVFSLEENFEEQKLGHLSTPNGYKDNGTAKKVASIMRKMVIKKRWKIIGSSRTGIVKKLFPKRIANLGLETKQRLNALFQRRQKSIDWNRTLLDFVGSTDLRILATCLVLQQEFSEVVLVTKDKTLSLVAKDITSVRVIDSVGKLGNIKSGDN